MVLLSLRPFIRYHHGGEHPSFHSWLTHHFNTLQVFYKALEHIKPELLSSQLPAFKQNVYFT